MDQSVAASPVGVDAEIAPEPDLEPAQNDQAHIASKIGIAGLVLVAGVIALAANALVIALTTPDFMPDDITDDPFAATSLASALPLIVGGVGLIFGIVAVRGARVLGERGVAIRGLVFGILNVVLAIAIGSVFVNFDLATAACGGG